MRLGLNWKSVESRAELEAVLPLIDQYGLGTIAAPSAMSDWSISRCKEFGEMVREYGLTVGELGYWENLLTTDDDVRTRRIQHVQELLKRADAMGVDCVVTLVGSFGGSWAGDPHPDNWTDRAREMVVENSQRILDGVSLNETTYALEPWYSSFFHKPRSVRSLLDDVDRAGFGVHMDMMNMHSIDDAYRSTDLIDDAFDLLADDIAAVHAKDIQVNPDSGVYQIEEVIPGDGSMDYDRYMCHLDELPDDVPVFTEHWDTDNQYVETIRRLREFAKRNDIEIVGR